MRKTVSKGNYTLFFEDKNDSIDCIAYKTGQHMSAIEIGNALKISRQSVSASIKNSLTKIYKKIRATKKTSPFETVCSMSIIFNLNDINEYRRLLSLFPNDIRREINNDAIKAARKAA
jgi:DNA-binding transcriptional regulator GbsR (MarR family)